MTATPTTITARLEAAREQLNAVYREVRAIAEAVDMLDQDALTSENEESVREVIDSLADVNRAIVGTDDPFESAVHHARKLGV